MKMHISRRLKGILSRKIFAEQFRFMEGRQIHETMGVAQEGLHSIKVKYSKAMVVKVDLSKAYEGVSWLYTRLILIYLGFCPQFVSWVMNCITYVSFVILINCVVSPFFRLERRLRKGCPLSPLLFLLVAEGLSR